MYLIREVLPDGGTAGRATAVAAALDELESVYSFIYARVGNQADSEDLTQEVALKALPRLDPEAPAPAIRGYLFATARSVLASFWSRRLRLRESELPDGIRDDARGAGPEASPETAADVAKMLSELSPTHRQVLELRFLRGYSLREVAAETGKSIGSVKLMQLRALRRAAALHATATS